MKTWNQVIQESIDSLIKAANAAEATAKAYRTVSNSSEFREATNKANEANEKMVDSTEKVVHAQKEQAKAQQTIITLAKETNTSWRSVIGTLGENVRQTERYKVELKQVQAEIKQQIKLNTDVHGVLRNVSAELIELRQREAELKQGISENNITIRQQIKELQAADGSMKKTSVTLGLMKQAYRELNEAEKNSEFGQTLLAQIQEIDTSMKGADASIGNFFRNVGNYKNTFSEAFDQVLSGDTDAAIKTLDGSFKSLVASSRAFIASPIGIAITALASIGLAAKAVWDYNEGIKENLILTEQFTGATGASADVIRQQAQAMTDTFGGEFQVNLNAAQKLVKAFGITYEEAFDQIGRGLANGGVANKEFFDSIKEYPQLFAMAGYSVDEFLNLINIGFEEGLYSDKLVDGIKEADLALKEQTKATRVALVNAFGGVWTDDLLRRIKTGETTTKNALIEIANQAQETGLNQQQLYQLTADVFKGAGEDAGGAAKYFDILGKAAEKSSVPLEGTAAHLEKLRLANVELQQAMDSALKSDSVINFSQQWEIAWVKLQTGFFEVIGVIRDAYEWFWRVSGRSETLGNIWNSLTRISDKVQQVIEYLSVTFGRIGEQLGITTEDSNGFMKAVIDLLDPIKWLEAGLNILVEVIEFVADGFINTTTYAEALGRTLGQLATFDLDNLKGIGGNVDDIKRENAEYSKRIQLEKERKKTMKEVSDFFQKLSDGAAAMVEADKEAERERKAAAEKAAKENEKRQKEYAAAQKKAADERKRLLEAQAREEIAIQSELLEIYKLNNQSKLKFDESFTLGAILLEKQRLDKIYQLELEHAEKVSGLKIAEVKAKFEAGQQMTSDELKLYRYSIEAAEKNSKDKQKIDDDLAKYKERTADENFELEKKRLALDLAYNLLLGQDKLKAEEAYYAAINELHLKHLEFKAVISREEVEEKYKRGEELTKAEQELLDAIFTLRREAQSKEQKAKDEEEAINDKRIEDSLEKIGESLGAEKEMRDIFEAYKKYQRISELEDEEATAYAKLELTASVFSAMASILGEYTAFGKAAAIASAAINAALAIINALNTSPAWLGIALSVAIGAAAALQIAKIATAQPPKAPKFSASFATGVINSDFEGNALVDEEGPELHYDRYGRLKFAGKSRPNIRKVKKGDTIFPASISKKIQEIANYNPFPDILTHFDFRNVNGGNDYKFEKLERKVDGVRKAVSTKPNYVWDGSNIVEISGGNGSSHQRTIPRFGKDKPTQNTLK